MTDRVPFPALALLALAFFASPAVAEDDPAPPPSRFFQAYDRDGDGRVTPDELGGDAEVFRLLDKNGDGAITPQDLGETADYRPRPAPKPQARPRRPEAGPRGPGAGPRGPRGAGGPGGPGGPDRRPSPEQVKAFFDRLDQNDDGVLDESEAPRPQMFARFDADQDGKVTREEFAGGIGRGMGGPRGRGARRKPAAERPRGLSEQALRRFDKNRDGKVTRDEFPGSDERFDQMDRNGDGALTEADRAERPPRSPTTAPATAPRGIRIGELDQDGNERLSRNEFPGTDAEWRRLDRNGDGWVTPDEVARPQNTGRRSGARWMRHDADGDGRVSRREFQGTDALFDELDRNQDGFLDAQDR